MSHEQAAAKARLTSPWRSRRSRTDLTIVVIPVDHAGLHVPNNSLERFAFPTVIDATLKLLTTESNQLASPQDYDR